MNLKLFFPWIAQVIFFVGILPQIILNFKHKSTKGLSDFLLIGYFNAYILYMFYVFSLDLPVAHKIMTPSAFFAVVILIFQRFYYSNSKDFKLRMFFILNSLIALSFVLIAIKNYFLVGHIAGWAMAILWAIYQLPQIIKNYKRQSVKGLSFAWLSILGIGDFTEFVVALYLGLPPQTYMNNFRGILVYLIFVYQFLKFRKN